MEVMRSAARFRAACDAARTNASTVALVPTMGALHEGHGSLLRRAREEAGLVAMSVFVNPLQFGQGEDFASYPRNLEGDVATAQEAGCDLVFAPPEEEMYPEGPLSVTVDPGELGDRMEGRSRPGHFRGVLTVVLKLLNLTGRCRAYFGEKDAQQLELVRRMTRDFDVPAGVVACATVRDLDGLALSSRNSRLSPEQRSAALSLVNALRRAARLVEEGERRASVLRAEMAKRIGAEPLARLDYVAVVNDRTWEEAEVLTAPSRALVAARFGPVRLIDNMLLRWPGT